MTNEGKHGFENKIYGFVTVGTKGQVVIPAEAREALGIQPGDHLFVMGSPKKGVVALLPETSAAEFVSMMSRKVQDFNQTVEDFEAVRQRGPENFED